MENPTKKITHVYFLYEIFTRRVYYSRWNLHLEFILQKVLQKALNTSNPEEGAGISSEMPVPM